jgi:hypothetical protein
MIIPIAATGSELHRSNRRVASCETGIWKEYAETKVELAAALLRETGITAAEESAIAAPRYVGAGVRAPAPQQLASEPKVLRTGGRPQTKTNPAVRKRGVASMCDYSLDFVASRPAKVGDKLVTTRFKNSVTRGFAAVEEPTVAVCLLPGTEVAFEKEVTCEHVFKVFRSQKLIGQKVARFRQINLEHPNVHHDALEFPEGQVLLLTQLDEGQHATVLQLPASPRATNEAEQQKRDSVVA